MPRIPLALAILTCIPPSAASQAQTEDARLLPSDGLDFGEFGRSLAIDGERLAVGARGAFLERVFVFERQGDEWVEDAVLGGFFLDGFGEDIALEGNTLVAGAPQDGGPGFCVVYEHDGVDWIQTAFLQALPSGLGSWVALDGDTLMASAFDVVVVFERTGGVWAEDAQILPPSGDFCCTDIALDGDTALFGVFESTSTAALHVYERSQGTWSQVDSLVPAELASVAASVGALALDGDTLAATFIPFGGQPPSAHVFKREAGVWTEGARLEPPDDEGAVGFFSDLVLQGDTILLSADPFDDEPGRVHVFERSDGSWIASVRLEASDAMGQFDGFGWSVAVDGRSVVVGATGVDGEGLSTGAAYVYELAGFPRVTRYGSELAPTGSLSVTAGVPAVGTALELGLDDPTGELDPGATGILVVSAAPDAAFPAGTPIPGFGPGGGNGELLVSLAPGDRLAQLSTGTWPGPGMPAPVRLVLPPDAALIDMVLYVQGLLVKSDGGPDARFRLTDALALSVVALP